MRGLFFQPRVRIVSQKDALPCSRPRGAPDVARRGTCDPVCGRPVPSTVVLEVATMTSTDFPYADRFPVHGLSLIHI